MATIKPFCCIRPVETKAAQIAALPYDVYNRSEAKEIVKENPASFLSIDRAETAFPDSVDTYAPEVYAKARELFWKRVEDGDFVREEKPAYYLYELTMGDRIQTGIVATASIDDYLNGVIKKHENTRAEKEEDRIHHVDTIGAQTGPIFLAYRKNEAIEKIVAKTKEGTPLYDFTSDDKVRHRVFVIASDTDIDILRSSFAGIDQIYIADGHHRAASAVKVGLKRREENPGFDGTEEFNFFLSVLFPDSELAIMDYNRVVKDLNGLSVLDFLTEVQKRFDVGEVSAVPIHPKEKGEFSMFLDGIWYPCKVRAEDKSADPVEGLDVSLLQKLLLTPVLGIGDPKTDKRIDFVGGIRGLTELEHRVHTDCAVAFAMFPTTIGELFAVADAGLLMPPKSTWFEPKLRSGLFIHEI